MPRRAVKLGKLLLALAVGVIAGIAVVFGFAQLTHAVLVALVGQDGIVDLDGTWAWFALTLLLYASGIGTGLTAGVLVWRRVGVHLK